MIKKVSPSKIKEIISRDMPHISAYNKDEMAIPSYLHKNPLIRWMMWRRYEYIAELARLTKSMNVLEFGCGTGLFLPELSSKCNTVYAIDIFPEYAKILNEELQLGVHFIDDLTDIPDDSLDAIVAADVLEHLSDDDLKRYLEMFSRKLHRSGRLIVSGPTESVVYKIGRVLAGFGDKGDYHLSNINILIDKITTSFDLSNIKYLPFRLPPHLFKVCEFINSKKLII